MCVIDYAPAGRVLTTTGNTINRGNRLVYRRTHDTRIWYGPRALAIRFHLSRTPSTTTIIIIIIIIIVLEIIGYIYIYMRTQLKLLLPAVVRARLLFGCTVYAHHTRNVRKRRIRCSRGP